MLESEHCCYWLCKTDSEVSRKEHKCQKLLEDHDVTKPPWQADRSQNLQELEVETFLARRLSLADQNTSQWNVLRRNLSAVYPACMVFKRRLICWISQKFPNSTTRAIRSKRLRQTVTEPEDIIIIFETIPNSEQNLVYCAIWRTMILIVIYPTT